MAMVPINHTDRYAVDIFIDKYWAGDVSSHGGVAARPPAAIRALKIGGQPVTVKWVWGWEEDPKTKRVLEPDEPHTVVAHFQPAAHTAIAIR